MRTQLTENLPHHCIRNGFLCVVMIFAFASQPTSAADVLPAQIDQAISKGKAYLYAQELDGNWESVPAPKAGSSANDPGGLQFGGMTALATFALLSCGDTPQNNDNLKAAVEWLKKADIRGTYALGLRSQIWPLLAEDPSNKKVEQRDKAMLLAGVRSKGEAAGFFSYGQGVDPAQTVQNESAEYDHSTSQFGVLGLWSIMQAGQEIDSRYWKLFDTGWRDHQQADGSWCYLAHPLGASVKAAEGLKGEELSMTAAGVATLFITQDNVNTSSRCEGNIKDKNIEAGMAWIGTHLKEIDGNDWAKSWHYYTMFGICRIGQASGFKYIGTTNWFQWGANLLTRDQDPANGSWGDPNPIAFTMGAGVLGTKVDQRVYDSAFALLFLSRGRAPVLFNKLQYNLAKTGTSKSALEGNWNQRPRDIANLTRYIGREREIAMNWQIVSLRQPVDDMLEAPLLFMAGNQAVKLAPEDIEKLRSYVNQGGIIIGHADCATVVFNDSFKKLGEAMFPGTTWREMPADHPICQLESFTSKNWMPKPHVEILENGARVRMLLLANGDPARQWQTQSFQRIKKDTFGQLMMDIYLYAVDKQPLRARGDTLVVKRIETDASVTTAVKVARLQYSGNWDPEPGGWPRLANIVHNKDHLDLTIVPVELGKGLLTNAYKLADLTGTDALKLTDPQIEELKKYVEGGGTLLIDAAGGKSAFAVSVQDILVKAFPGSGVLKALPHDSAVYSVGTPIKEVGYRQFTLATLGNLHTPQLRGMMTGDRISVLLSNEDVAVGLVGQPVDGVIGYDPPSAAHIAENIVLYAVNPAGAVATQPTTAPSKD